MMRINFTRLSMWLVCCVNFINSASIYDQDTNSQNSRSSTLDEKLDSLQPSVPSRVSTANSIEEDAFSPLEIWSNADDKTKTQILSAFLQELPFLTEGLERPEKRHNFGFMGNRGKRTKEGAVSSGEHFLQAVRPHFNRAMSPLARLINSRRESQEMFNNKRQPDFGFHAVRG